MLNSISYSLGKNPSGKCISESIFETTTLITRCKNVNQPRRAFGCTHRSIKNYWLDMEVTFHCTPEVAAKSQSPTTRLMNRTLLQIVTTSLCTQHTRNECTPISDRINGLRKAIMSSQGHPECQTEQP